MEVKKKKYITLIEMMIVMALIGIISGVIVYNLSGSLDKGKVFSTQQKAKQIKHALVLEAMESSKSYEMVQGDWEDIIKQSPLFDRTLGEVLLQDAWGDKYEVTVDTDDYENEDFIVTSLRLQSANETTR